MPEFTGEHDAVVDAGVPDDAEVPDDVEVPDDAEASADVADPSGVTHVADAADLADEDVLLLEEAESELVLPVWEPTGDPQVDAALDLLTTLDPDDVHQHAAVFDEIHQGLRGRLTDLDAS